MTARRLAAGGQIDRSRPLRFTWEGHPFQGFAGDTLASALLAAGVDVVGRSFKYHRPRGLMAAGAEEPNGLIQLGAGARGEPNLRATEAELVDGLVARPVNCWPSARHDIGALAGLLGRFIPVGFYYKTFMWPNWRWFEPFIRRAAGLGRPAQEPDPDRYEHRYVHCDVLVVGSGRAGLEATLAASRDGLRVILAEQDTLLGGPLPDPGWVEKAAAEFRGAPDTIVLTRTTAVGYFDHNSLTLIERLVETRPGRPRQRVWIVRAVKVVLATGALERPIVFPGNDRPGVMLASAVSQYLARWAVLAGERAVIFTNNDSAYQTAHDILDAGGSLTAVLDSRPSPSAALLNGLRARGAGVLAGATVVGTRGVPSLRGVDINDGEGRVRRLRADLLAVSGGWNPTVHLFSQSGGRLAWDDEIAAFRPGVSVQAEVSVGAAAGDFEPPLSIEPLWRVEGPGRAFVDFQNDVTADDIELSARENFVSVEHLKRYTTLGMAPDQGKTSNVNALAIMAELTGRSIPQTGTTRFRFPYTPLAIGALAGRARGELFRPLRRLPTHELQQKWRGVLEDYGGWLRPSCYPYSDETPHDAQQREALAVRQAAGLFEASPLGKIEVVGPDAAEFLDRIYANTMSTLRVGAIRYGLMLNELGVVIDDGVCSRLADDRFLVGTTSAGAERIAAWLEEWLQCEWTDLDVLVAPMTGAVGVLTVCGPEARVVLEAAGADFPVGPAEFPHMTFRTGTVADIPVQVARVSFTGEVSVELSVPSDRTAALWIELIASGLPRGMTKIGVEAWMLLRTEKGYLHVGADTDGSTLPGDVGFGHVATRRHDFVGRRSLHLTQALRQDRLQFVGLESVGETAALEVGAHLRGAALNSGSEGYVSSAGFSPILERGVALGMVRFGRARHGEELRIVSGEGEGRRVRVTAPGAYDPLGERVRG
jgi:sarcosine oxidase subunit alpha